MSFVIDKKQNFGLTFLERGKYMFTFHDTNTKSAMTVGLQDCGGSYL